MEESVNERLINANGVSVGLYNQIVRQLPEGVRVQDYESPAAVGCRFKSVGAVGMPGEYAAFPAVQMQGVEMPAVGNVEKRAVELSLQKPCFAQEAAFEYMMRVEFPPGAYGIVAAVQFVLEI